MRVGVLLVDKGDYVVLVVLVGSGFVGVVGSFAFESHRFVHGSDSAAGVEVVESAVLELSLIVGVGGRELEGTGHFS